MSETVNLKAYFDRIGFSGSIAPTLATLEALTGLHPAAIPFENIDPLLGRPVALDQKSLEKKLLADRRGGYCFEHNHLLWRVLADLDFAVRGFAARVVWNQPEGRRLPVSHMLLGVEISGATYIADVGFGGQTPTAPLRLRNGVEQETRHETYRLIETEEGWRLEMLAGADWRALYVFDLTAFAQADYLPINQALSTDPASRFRNGLFVALAPKETRLSLAGNRLTVRRAGAEAETRMLEDAAALRAVLGETFGLALPEDEGLEPALEAIVAAGRAEADEPSS